MKRIIVGLALTTGAALVAAPPAQAAPKADPVKALQAQVAPGKGVNVSLITRIALDGKRLATIRTERVAGFRKGWQVDTDETTSVYAPDSAESLQADFRFPTLVIRAKGVSYTSGGELIGMLPLDKKWVRDIPGESRPADLTVDLFQPGALKALLATASSVSSRSAEGAIDIRKIPGRPFGSRNGVKIAWALWFDDKGRVTRLTTMLADQRLSDRRLDVSADVRFTGWGAKVTVEPPPADLVTRSEDVPALEESLEPAPKKLIDALPKAH
ncbi:MULTISPECIES: hypothetical protein [unclassified Nonomuraea]